MSKLSKYDEIREAVAQQYLIARADSDRAKKAVEDTLLVMKKELGASHSAVWFSSYAITARSSARTFLDRPVVVAVENRDCWWYGWIVVDVLNSSQGCDIVATINFRVSATYEEEKYYYFLGHRPLILSSDPNDADAPRKFAIDAVEILIDSAKNAHRARMDEDGMVIARES